MRFKLSRKTPLLGGLACILLYLLLPVLAGAFEWGDRRGPRIYPIDLHSPLYLVGWNLTEPSEDRPRLLAHDTSSRPWFYGL